MKIGVISDVHDNSRHLKKAIDYFNDNNIELLSHCGDFDMPFTLEVYKDLKCPIKAVLGNGDPDIQKFQFQLQNKFPDLKLEISERFQDFQADGKRFAIFHGNDEMLVRAIIESQLYDVFCIGHSHKAKIEQNGKTLIINPGSLVGVYYPSFNEPVTIAIYDTETDKAEIINIDEL